MDISCAALALALSNPAGGGSFTLTSDCPSRDGQPALVIRHVFKRPVTVYANGRVIRGIVIDGGGNLVWNGGRIEAPAGSGDDPRQGGPQYYGVQIKGDARSIAFEGVSFANARKAIVFSGPAQGLTVRNSRCQGNVEDCLIASGGRDIVFTHNIAGPFTSRPSLCVIGSVSFDRIAKRDCLARNGEWRNGWHSDVLQLRNGIANVLVAYNVINTTGQGLTQMDKPTDAPIRSVRFTNNRIQAGRHGLTLGRCEDCLIDQNELKTSMGHLNWKAVIIPGQARACGNIVPSGGKGTDSCQTAGVKRPS